MDRVAQPLATLAEKIATLTISGAPTLLGTDKGSEGVFVREARRRYGAKGISRAGREALEEWLTKRGVPLAGGASDENTALFLDACRAAALRGVDPVAALGAAVNARVEEDAATPPLPGLVPV